MLVLAVCSLATTRRLQIEERRIPEPAFSRVVIEEGGDIEKELAPPPRAVRVVPPSPGPEFFWVDGYWYPAGRDYRWHSGYWTRPPYPAARWVAPRRDGERFFAGYWEGDHGRFEHDHHRDHDRDRDFRDHDRH